jgi:hypothetical protein
MNYIEMTLLCEGCEEECGGSSCEVWRHFKEAALDEIDGADKS